MGNANGRHQTVSCGSPKLRSYLESEADASDIDCSDSISCSGFPFSPRSLARKYCFAAAACGIRQEAATAALEADRQTLLGRAAPALAGMAESTLDCRTFDGRRLASQGIQTVLETAFP